MKRYVLFTLLIGMVFSFSVGCDNKKEVRRIFKDKYRPAKVGETVILADRSKVILTEDDLLIPAAGTYPSASWWTGWENKYPYKNFPWLMEDIKTLEKEYWREFGGCRKPDSLAGSADCNKDFGTLKRVKDLVISKSIEEMRRKSDLTGHDYGQIYYTFWIEGSWTGETNEFGAKKIKPELYFQITVTRGTLSLSDGVALEADRRIQNRLNSHPGMIKLKNLKINTIRTSRPE